MRAHLAPALASSLALGVLLAAAIADPGQVSVHRDGRAYTVRMSVELDAPATRVRDILTDYAHLNRINPAVVASEVLSAPAPGVARVRTHLRSCVWFFCREFHLVEDLRIGPDGDIEAEVVAELSDMKRGAAHWDLEPVGAGTLLNYASTMEPRFWVPPLIGPRAIMKSLRENLSVTAANLERLAGGSDAGGDPDR